MNRLFSLIISVGDKFSSQRVGSQRVRPSALIYIENSADARQNLKAV